MTDNARGSLERISRRVPVPEPAYERLLRRRDRKQRNRRLSAAVVALAFALLSIAALAGAFRNVERPATEPTSTPVDRGIFSGIGGWIAFAKPDGIWAADPERPSDPQAQIQLSPDLGEPLAWSRDGSKLLILSGQFTSEETLSVLNADGSATLLVHGCGYCLSGGSFSPDGSEVVYAGGSGSGFGIYAIGADGGTPTRLLDGDGCCGGDPTFSPDGSRIAYFDGLGDSNNTLRVMNADGSGSHVLLRDAGVMKRSGRLGYLAWFPDGRRLVFAMGRGYSGAIYVVRSDGSGLRRLILPGVQPELSPDGSRIAYTSKAYGKNGGPWRPLIIADIDGTHVRLLHDFRPGPWYPLDRAESGTDGSVSAVTTRPDALIYAIAAMVVSGLVVLWRRKRPRERSGRWLRTRVPGGDEG